MNYSLKNTHAGLIKFGTLEHMKAFYETGEMYFNTFNYFKKLDTSSDGRADKNEYSSIHYSGDYIKNITLSIAPVDNPENNITIQGGIDISRITIDFGNDKKYTHLYSMSYIDLAWALENNLIIDKRNFTEGKEYAVIINDFNKFVEIFINHMKSLKTNAMGKVIEYINPNTYSGEVGPFRKFEEYSYQNEYRFAVNFNCNEPMKIHLGSLKDIARPPMNKEEFYNKELKIHIINKNGEHTLETIKNINKTCKLL